MPISTCCQNTLTFVEVEAVAQQPHDEHAGEDAEHRAAAAEEAGAADDHRGDGVELGADAGVREAGTGAAGEQQPGEPGEEAGERVDEHQDARRR